MIRVLVVDDSQVAREYLTHILGEDAAVNVIGTANNGVEAVEIAGRLKPDVITMDINMPAMDGLEFLRQIRVQNLAPGIPVVMITTESSEEHVRQAIEAGARGYIRKPFTAEQVKERVLPLVRAA